MAVAAELPEPPALGRLTWVGAGLLALALLVATSTWYRLAEWPNAPDFIAVLGWQILTWAPWLALAWIVDRVATAFPLEDSRFRDLAAHLAAAILLAAMHTGWFVVISSWMSPLGELPDTRYGVFRFFFLFWFQLDMVLYGAIAGLSLTHRYQRRARERARRAAEMELRWTESQLESLRLQIRPHFLFNTLNAIIVMQRSGESRAARETLEALAEILRALLSADGAQEASLAEEKALVERYLFIERHRFGDRLDVRWDVPSELQSARLPSLALQTLVENAVRIGAGGREGTCRIDIRAQREGGRLNFEICNPRGDDIEGLGIGLENTRARLRALYGDRQHLRLTHLDDRTCVDMSLPYREEPER